MCVVISVMQIQAMHPMFGNEITLFDAISFAFGALTQQGSALEMRTVSGRLVVLTTFLANLALFTSYSGNLCSMMQVVLVFALDSVLLSIFPASRQQ